MVDGNGIELTLGDIVNCPLLKYHNPYRVISLKSGNRTFLNHIILRPQNENPETAQRYLVHPSQVYKLK